MLISVACYQFSLFTLSEITNLISQRPYLFLLLQLGTIMDRKSGGGLILEVHSGKPAVHPSFKVEPGKR